MEEASGTVVEGSGILFSNALYLYTGYTVCLLHICLPATIKAASSETEFGTLPLQQIMWICVDEAERFG